MWELLARAQEIDEAEDRHYGQGRRGDELPAELAKRESRLKKIREAKRALEQEAKAQAELQVAAARARRAQRQQREKTTGQKLRGRRPRIPDPKQAKPEPKAQRNFTDPDSRIMKDAATKSFQQAYNAQLAVDSHAQVIVVAAVTQAANDSQQLVPMLGQVEHQLGRKPEKGSADAGYFSQAQLTDERLEGIDLYVAPAPQPRGAEASVIEQMRRKLKTAEGQAIYKMRKAIVEPVFGQIKQGRGFRRFSFRGKEKVSAEWQLICLTHNLLKLFRAQLSLKVA